jgi:hypothetical protein
VKVQDVPSGGVFIVMSATFTSVLISIAGLCLSGLYPTWGAALNFPMTASVFFFGIFLLCTIVPWGWVRGPQGGQISHAIVHCAKKSQLSDKRICLYLFAVYFISFGTLIVVSLSPIPSLYRFMCVLVSAGMLIDLAKMIYRRLQFRAGPEGLADWLLETMRTAERKSNHDSLVEGFESTFSILTGYLKMDDVASLKLFCLKIIENADFWIRASSQLPGNLGGVDKDPSVLDNYTIVEAMVAKRMASILQVESLVVLETLIWFEGKLVLAFHKRHSSLGYLLLFSLSVILQQADGKIDRTSKEIEYITMLSEVIKAFIDRAAATRISDRASIFKGLSLLESHLKESFRNDRNINPAFLMQPFAEVGQLIADEKYAQMPDRDDIIAELRRLLSQFAALESVRAQMDIGVEGTDTKASYKEDKPFLSR